MQHTYHVSPESPDFKYNNAIVMSVVNIDDDFAFYKERGDVLIANDLQVDTEDMREDVLSLLTKIYEGEYLDDPVAGANVLFDEIAPSMWLKPITKDGYYINPKIFTILSKIMTKDKVNMLQYAIDPSYRPPTNLTHTGVVRAFIEAKFPRGIREFYTHFDDIMQIVLFNQFDKRENKRQTQYSKPMSYSRADYTAMMIRKFRDRVFCTHLPVPSKHAFVMEKKGKNKISEVPLMQYAFDAVNTITSLSQRLRPVTIREASRLDYKVNNLMALFYEAYGSQQMKSKYGNMRKNTYGTPTSFNARAVLVSRQGLCQYDALKISYSIGFKLFEHQVSKRLIDREATTPIEIFELRSQYAHQFSPKIHGMMTELIMDFWGGTGWKCNILRHPYLSTLSSQFVGIDEIGTDPLDNTIQMPLPLLKGPN